MRAQDQWLQAGVLSMSVALAYDKQLAKSYEQSFDPFGGKTAAKQAHKMKAPDLVKAENLEQIPEKGRVAVTCKSGMRATMAATGLRHIGFDNVYVLVGGYQELAKEVSPKTVY